MLQILKMSFCFLSLFFIVAFSSIIYFGSFVISFLFSSSVLYQKAKSIFFILVYEIFYLNNNVITIYNLVTSHCSTPDNRENFFNKMLCIFFTFIYNLLKFFCCQKPSSSVEFELILLTL
jgi:hypothetical protein